MAELIRWPELMKRAQEEVRSHVRRSKVKVEESDLRQLHYLKFTVKETMRLHPPASMLIHRETMNLATLSDGYQIPPKTTIYVNAWAIGSDPDACERPEVFDPERFVNMASLSVDSFAHYDFKLIPFGDVGASTSFADRAVRSCFFNVIYPMLSLFIFPQDF